MTSGNLWKQMFVFSIPLMFSNLMQVLFNMSDVAIVGRFAGPIALGAVGSTTILVSLFIGFLIGLGGGVNALAARYYGARDYHNMSSFVHSAILVCFAAGLIVCIIGQITAGSILHLLNTKSELYPGALLYLRIYFLGTPALALFDFGNGVMSAVGDTRRPLMFLVFSGIINVILNLFFVIVCHFDVQGVAAASVISEYISAALILHLLLHEEGPYHLEFKKIKLHRYKTINLLKIGIPSGFQYAIFGIANLFIQTAVNSFDSTMVAGSAAAANNETLIYTMMSAFYTASASFIGQNYGANKPDRMKKACIIGNVYSLLCSVIYCGLILVFRHAFLSLFTTEEAVINAGLYRLIVLCCSIWISSFMDNAVAACRGLGKTLIPTITVICGSCLFRILWIFTVFAHFHTPYSLFLLYPCSWVITSALVLAYFCVAYKQAVRQMTLMYR